MADRNICPTTHLVLLPLPNAGLAVAFVDGDAEAFDFGGGAAQGLVQAFADVGSQQFGRGVGDWQDSAVASGEDPAAVFEFDRHFVAIVGDVDLWMARGEEHVVIEPGGDLEQFGADQQEVDDEVVVVHRGGNLGRDAVVVTVQAFAMVGEGDEVAGAEDVLGFRDVDFVGFGHGGR